MFLINEILVFAPGRRQEALDRLAWIHGLMAPSPGFREAIVARDLGHPTRHTVMRVWEDEAAYQQFREGPNGNYGRNRPVGLYTNEQVVPQWNSVHEATGSAQGNYLVKIQRAVPEGAADASGRYTQGYRDLLGSHGDVASHWVFHAKDRPELLAIVRFRNQEAADRFVDSSEHARHVETRPEELPAATIECFEVASEVFPKKD
jgi:heme-degrading monooxygenase HmoA